MLTTLPQNAKNYIGMFFFFFNSFCSLANWISLRIIYVLVSGNEHEVSREGSKGNQHDVCVRYKMYLGAGIMQPNSKRPEAIFVLKFDRCEN